MDPTLARAVHGRGQAAEPEAARRERHLLASSETTQPSESPVAWSSFATGVNPGKHNIYDFLVRDFADLHARPRRGEEGAARVPVGLLPDASARRSPPRAAARRSGSTPGSDGVKSVDPHRAHDLPARGGRSTARCSAGLPAARHPRHPRHLLLLGHRPLLLRGGQHRVRRLPEAPALRRRRGRRPCCKGPESPILKQEEARAAREEEGGRRSPSKETARGSRSWPPART